jgi:hypothetical protein
MLKVVCELKFYKALAHILLFIYFFMVLGFELRVWACQAGTLPQEPRLQPSFTQFNTLFLKKDRIVLGMQLSGRALA